MMRTRILIGTLILTALGALFWLDHYWGGYFVCLAAMLMTAVSLHELYAMSRKADLRPFTWTGIAFGTALLPYYMWSEVLEIPLGHQALTAFLAAPFVALILVLMGRALSRSEGLESQLKNIAVTVFGVLYVALPMAFLVRIRFLEEGWSLVILVVAVAKASDMGAYLAGSTVGRHKLAPRISPGKTVEGAGGGIVASCLASLLVGYGMKVHALIDQGFWATIAFGTVIAVASQVGDLAESLVKRTTGTKDSGNLLPAFGGMLDMVDSLLVAAPVAYFLLSILLNLAA